MSLNPLAAPAPSVTSVSDSFRLGTVTQLDPLRVKLDGDTGATDATPINTTGPVVAGDRVWCQIHGKALLVVGAVTAHERDLFLQNFRSILTGGGLRTATTSGVAWTQRLIALGAGRNAFAPNGFQEITMPPSGTVIPVIGHSGLDSVTVSSVVPLPSWHVLWYDVPLGGAAASDPSRFKVTNYTLPFDVPPTWVPVVRKNYDLGTYTWADGQETAPWIYPSLNSPWTVYGQGYMPPRYKRQNGIVYLEGLVRGTTTGATTTGTIFMLPAGFRPDAGNTIFITHASGGVTDLRVYTSGSVVASGYLAGGNANDVSLNGISFPADQ